MDIEKYRMLHSNTTILKTYLSYRKHYATKKDIIFGKEKLCRIVFDTLICVSDQDHKFEKFRKVTFHANYLWTPLMTQLKDWVWSLSPSGICHPCALLQETSEGTYNNFILIFPQTFLQSSCVGYVYNLLYQE